MIINVYILECSDGSLYTGWTNDLDKRLAAHNSGTASKCTRARRPVKLVYSEEVGSKSDALKREAAIKKLSREQKLALIAQFVFASEARQSCLSTAPVIPGEVPESIIDVAEDICDVAESAVKTENILSSSEKMVFSSSRLTLGVKSEDVSSPLERVVSGSSRLTPGVPFAGHKIFLTGVPGVGKSTIIGKIVSEIGICPRGFNTLARPLDNAVIPGEVPESNSLTSPVIASEARQSSPLTLPVIPGEVPESTAQYNEGIYIVPYGDTPLWGMSPGMSIEPYGDTPLRGTSPRMSHGMSPVGARNRGERKVTAYPEVFDTLGVQILTSAQDSELIIMDELGFMESEAYKFQEKVLEILANNTNILGVIKPKRTPFLDAIRAIAGIEIIEVTPENRDEIPAQILAMLV